MHIISVNSFKKTLLLLFIINNTFIHSVDSQNRRIKSQFSQQDFEKNKVFNEIYHLWKFNNKSIPKKNDTLQQPYFVDDRNYKGLINYGIQFRSKDFRNFHYLEGRYMHFLRVAIEKALFNSKDSILEIEGYVSGGWGDSANKKQITTGIENHIDVFLGTKTDTIKHCYYSSAVNEEFIEVKLNNREVDENTILDTFPAFYFTNYSHYKTAPKGKRYFKIKGKVTTNTYLAFGGINCYSEIFDLSAMVYTPNKSRRKKIESREIPSYKTLIVNNKLVEDADKEKATLHTISYYDFTEKAETFILRKQYAKAKEQYLLLDEEYPILFARDIHNAIRCAVLSRDHKNALYWSEKLAKKGVALTYFKASIFNTLKRNSNWNDFTTRYDSIYKASLEKYNKNLKTQIEALKEEDQADYGLANRKEPKILYETTETVTNKLIILLKEEGYPSEEKIGVYTVNDTLINLSPEFNILIRHAIQQAPKNLNTLNEILEKYIKNLEYDRKRSSNETFYYNSCFHIYKGNLYISKDCGENDLIAQKIKFTFNNPYNFLIPNNDFIITEYNKDNPNEYDKYYKENYNFVTKLTDDWFFYEK